MKCTGKKTLFAGLILGIIFALVNFLGIMGGLLGIPVSYISGAWLGDYYLTFGGGESAIGTAMLIILLINCFRSELHGVTCRLGE